MRDVFGRADLATRCVGFIRNVVPSPDASYAYPTPWAHVPVNLITDTVEPLIAGEWISVVHGGSEFSEQHWWPIVEHYLSTQAG
ncbi:hypothetical protein CVV68_01275 [Arthrobacter livingstonensis]|uniref:Uncharacterized protein n=2 Tax=Arthrobacter livingstonensis TaxID=670078 RepID=A0A2V5LE38_9MICC|nr:hypothetical protein CVV68_01275 [Arthrobacter livingstonensis]